MFSTQGCFSVRGPRWSEALETVATGLHRKPPEWLRAAPTRTPILCPCRRPGCRPCCRCIPGRPQHPLTPFVLSAEHLVCRGTHKAALSLVGRPVVEMKAAHTGVGFTVESVLWQVGPAGWRPWSACRGHCGRHGGSLSVRCYLQQSFPLTDGARILNNLYLNCQVTFF